MSYRGTPVVIQEVYLDANNRPVADSQGGWVGTIAAANPKMDADNSVIEIIAQDWLSLLGRPSGKRFNSVDHQSRPGCANDTFMDAAPKLKGKKLNWMGHDVNDAIGGGNGGGGCPVIEARVRRLRDGEVIEARAGTIRVGDVLLTADPVTLEPGTARVIYSAMEWRPCVSVETVTGEALTCSYSAPLPTQRGLVKAPHVGGLDLAVYGDGWRDVKRVREAGMRWVQHITLEGESHCFWCNDILHHNKKSIRYRR